MFNSFLVGKNRFHWRLLPLCGWAILSVGSSFGQEWTRFRGPNGSGIGRDLNLPAELSAKDFNWKVDLAGSGHSSPVVWGERIFVSATAPKTSKRVLICLGAQKGEVIWQKEFETGEYHLHADNSYSSSSPAVDADRVYFHWAAPEGSALVALDQKDGHEVWRKNLGPFVSQHGPGTSPIVFEGLVLLNFDQDEPQSYLLAVDAVTGDQRWRYEHPGTSSSASTPCILKSQDGVPEVILTSRTVGLSAVDARNGSLRWEMAGLIPKRCIASPVLTESGLVVAQCGEGRSESFVYAVRPGIGAQPAQKLYEVLRTGGYVPTPVAVGGLLFLWKENGLVTCLRAASNEQLWSERVEGPFYGSPVVANGRIFNMSVRGELVILGAGEKFEQLGRIALGEGSHASPAISGGRMYLRTFSHLISIGK